MSAFDLAASVPWAAEPATLALILRIAAREGDGPEVVATRLGRPLQNSRNSELRGTTAIVPLTGPMFRRANLFSQVSGATSTEQFAKEFQSAIDNPDVASIILNIDSGGGEASGVNEVAKTIASARGKKPIKAYVSNMAASGAYWIASAADEIVIDDTALLGSIGVVSQQRVGQDKNTIEIVSSQSPNKRIDPTTDEGRAKIQRTVDSLAEVFIASVAANRGVTVDDVKGKFAQGGLEIGADAISLGMADRIGTLEGLISELNGATMATTTAAVAAGIQPGDITADYISRNFASVADALRAEGVAVEASKTAAAVAAARSEGAAAERQRLLDIEAAALPGYDDIVAAAKADPTKTAADVALSIVASQKAAGTSTISRLRAADAALPVLAPSVSTDPAPAVDASAPVEDRAKAEWDKSPAIRAEFANGFGSYLAYRRAEESGRVRRLAR